MKNSILLLSSIMFLSLSSCKTKSKSQSTSTVSEKGTEGTITPTSEPTVYKGVTDQACAVEMAFGSAGGGIDGPSYDKVIAAINDKKVKYTSKNIGREGEQRICLPLTEIKSDEERREFIGQLKKIAASGQLVSLSIR